MEKPAYTKGTISLISELLKMKQRKIKRTFVTNVKCLAQCLVYTTWSDTTLW